MARVLNRQTKALVDTVALERRTTSLLAFAGVAHLKLLITLCGPARITRLNGRYLRKHRPTDVISLQMIEMERPGQLPRHIQVGETLGKVYMGVPVVVAQSEQLGVSVDQRLAALVAHSLCHCLGYTHEEEEDYLRMRSHEQSLLEQLSDAEGIPFHVHYDADV